MASSQAFELLGYRLEADRGYDPETHLWVHRCGPADVRVGFDPLGRETSGDIVAISFVAVGTRVDRGGELGSLEAAKFVGPLIAPVAGIVRVHNQAVVADPGLLNEDPMAHWLVELELDGEPAGLLHGEADVAGWFAAEVARFRAQGAIAE